MPLILHLSDLHLADWDVAVGDYGKGVTLPGRDEQTVGLVLEESMRALSHALTRADQTLDAVVVSGDITSRADRAGFARLQPLLDLLGPAHPGPGNVLVVPGNHDVDWSLPPSVAERYEGFLALREHGYATPLLEGVDIAVGAGIAPTDPATPIVIDPEGNYVLIGLNSSNYCGTPSGASTVLEDEMRRASSPDVLDALTRVRAGLTAGATFDLARIDGRQLRALERRLQEAAIPEGALRILVLHHQISPVTSVEELKPFESIINLGQVNDFVVANRVDVVLHGHKHVARAETQWVSSTQSPVHRRLVAVVSAPAVDVRQVADFARLIDIPDSPESKPSQLLVREIPARTSSFPYSLVDSACRQLALHEGSTFSGMTITAVHDQLLSHRERYAELDAPLICRVEDGSSCATLPAHYPDLVGVSAVDLLATAVDWWQRPVRGRAAAFNHGERLWSSDRGVSQLDRIVSLLTSAGATTTSRALAVIVDPARDNLVDTAPFPSFVTLQFLARAGRLDLIATFRKQEMPHWWPINMAELARLQAWVVNQVGQESLLAGSITTVTAVPRNGHAVPRVAVPWLERQLDAPAALLKLVLPLLLLPSTEADRERSLATWTDAFGDWEPPTEAPADGERAPVKSLELLSEMIETSCNGPLHEPVRQIARAIGELAFRNRTYAGSDGSTGDDSLRKEWATHVSALRQDVLRRVAAVLRADATATTSSDLSGRREDVF